MPQAIRKKCNSCGNMYGCHKGTPGDQGGLCPTCYGKSVMYQPATMTAPTFNITEPKEQGKKFTINIDGKATITIE